MEQHRVSRENYRRTVLVYHGLPVAAALALVGVFAAGFFLTGKVLLSSLAAGMASAFLVWRWILAGKEIDRLGCPKCGNPFPKKLYWRYPPNVCPSCGERPE